MTRLALGVAAFAALLSGCTSVPAPPQPPSVAAPPPANAPKLIVAIAVDQFSADLFDEYRANFTGGLGRLANQGIVFHNGFQAHAATETCPGHSTILTGMYPAHTGIVANIWFQPAGPRGRQPIYCAEDESKNPTTYDPINYTVSPIHLRVPVLGELLKAASPQSQSVAVAGKDRAAVMMGGHTPDARWYYRTRGSAGKFESDLPGAAETSAVTEINRRVAAEIDTEQAPPLAVPAFCESRDKAVTLQPGGRVVGTGRFAHGPDEKEYHASPALDRDTLALAEGLLDERQLGRDAAPDVLAISLSATDYVGHRFGTEGLEMCLQLNQLDQLLGHFFDDLDARHIDYAVVLTADHGGTDVPERLREGRDPEARRAPDDLNSLTIGNKIAAQLGLSESPLTGEGDVYVAAGLDDSTRAKVLQMAVEAYRASPYVAEVFTKAELAAAPIPTGDPTKWSLKDRARASSDAERSGDLVVLLKRDIVPIARPDEFYAATHGSAWDNDRRVPIVFWRPRMEATTRDEPIRTVDIMPTLAAMLGLPVAPASLDGRCLASVTLCP
jgi:predicted AlkP superfamily pyrophosphatase or phosphodiesterase